MSNGAQPSESVVRLMKTHGTYALYERLRAGEPLESVLGEVEIAEGAATQKASAPARAKDSAKAEEPAQAEVEQEAETEAEAE